MRIYSFEKLSVWQNARKFTKSIYEVTLKFPSEEKFGLVTQMRRAAISVSSNIAEGSSRATTKDQSHFYNTAYSSLMEVLSQVILSGDLGFISDEEMESMRESIETISFQLASLRKSLNVPTP